MQVLVQHGAKGYVGEFDENGRIQGKIPKYIKREDDRIFFEVICLDNTFVNCDKLKIAPEIPSGIMTMRNTFKGCINLRTASEIPQSVHTMEHTFEGCTSLRGELKINITQKPTETYWNDGCFYYAATSGEVLTLVGSNEEVLNALKNTGSENSKIEIRVEK